MASRGLGSLTLDLIARIAGFTGPMDQAARNADKNFKKISDSASKFGKALGTGIGLAAVAATTALIGITKAAIDNADAIRDLSIRTGIGTETLSAYGYAASQTGTDIESLAKGLRVLATNAAAAQNDTSKQAKIFDALGISVTDATGKLKELDVLVPEIATKFKNLEDGTVKAATAAALFGARNGGQLIEFLNQGGEGLDEFTAKARELGLVVDQDTADAADKFKDTLGEVKATVGGLGLSIAKELLPALQRGADDFKELVQEGDLAHNMVTLLSAAVSLGVGAIDAYGNAVKRTGAIMDFMVQAGQGWQESVRNIWAPWSDGTVANGIAKMKQAIAEGDKALADINNPKKNPFANVRGGASTVDPNARATDARALALALSNPRAPKSGGKKGKSDAEREAEQLLKAYQNMEASYREQIALVGDVTEVERLRYELTNGEGKKFTESQKATLLALAAEKDAVDAAHAQLEEGKRLTESLLTPLEQVNEYRKEAKELLDAGAISQETYNKALSANLTPAEEVNAAILEEINLLGMSVEEQEIYNNLKSAGVDANSAWGQSIIENTEALQKLREETAFFDDLKEGLSDMFVDFISGSKSAKDAFGDFADAIYKRALQFVADKAVQALFDAFGGTQTNSSASSSSGWAALFGSFFGGGKASGGMVQPGKFYEVGEGNRPEMFMSGNRQYMIPGNAGNVTPLTGSGATIINNFSLPRRFDNRSEKQVAQATGRAIRQAR